MILPQIHFSLSPGISRGQGASHVSTTVLWAAVTTKGLLSLSFLCSHRSTVAAHSLSGRSLPTTPAPLRRLWAVPRMLSLGAAKFPVFRSIRLALPFVRGWGKCPSPHPGPHFSWHKLLFRTPWSFCPLLEVESLSCHRWSWLNGCMRVGNQVLPSRRKFSLGCKEAFSFWIKNYSCPLIETSNQRSRSNKDVSDWDIKYSYLCRVGISSAAL